MEKSLSSFHGLVLSFARLAILTSCGCTVALIAIPHHRRRENSEWIGRELANSCDWDDLANQVNCGVHPPSLSNWAILLVTAERQ